MTNKKDIIMKVGDKVTSPYGNGIIRRVYRNGDFNVDTERQMMGRKVCCVFSPCDIALIGCTPVGMKLSSQHEHATKDFMG